ncbi:MAG: START-like domain-containing protein, partial [Saprospiraceae bacterium]
MERVSFTLEFLFRASPTILYKFFKSPDNIIRWFCDEADAENDVYTFVWDGAEEVAELVDDIEEERIRFKWEDADDEDEFLEIRWRRSEVTGETI